VVWRTAGVPNRKLLGAYATALVLGGSYAAVTGGPFGRGQDLPKYVTAPVTQGPLQVTVTATGPVTNPQNLPLSFKNAGMLAELDLAVGQSVKAGQVRAQLDTADLQAQVA
jgi:HlyD family secretion protein